MTPKDFPERNKIYEKTEKDGFNLYVHNDGTQLISCFEMTSDEKMLAAFFGDVYLSVTGQIQPHVWITTRNPFYDPNQPITPDKEIIDNFIKRKITQFLRREFTGEDELSGKQLDYFPEFLKEFTNFLFDRYDLDCGDNCGHTAEEHSAFDMGFHAGRRGREVENPFKDSNTREAWENGYSVGKIVFEGEDE